MFAYQISFQVLQRIDSKLVERFTKAEFVTINVHGIALATELANNTGSCTLATIATMGN